MGLFMEVIGIYEPLTRLTDMWSPFGLGNRLSFLVYPDAHYGANSLVENNSGAIARV